PTSPQRLAPPGAPAPPPRSKKDTESTRRAATRRHSRGVGALFSTLLAAATCGRCERPATVGDEVVQICLSKNEPTRPPTAFASEPPDLGWAARELRPQADRAVRWLRPSRPPAGRRQPRPPSGAQPAPPAPRDAPRRQRLAEHAQCRGRPRNRQAPQASRAARATVPRRSLHDPEGPHPHDCRGGRPYGAVARRPGPGVGHSPASSTGPPAAPAACGAIGTTRGRSGRPRRFATA